MGVALKYHFRDPATQGIREATAEEVANLVQNSTKPVFLTCLGMDAFSGKTEPERTIRCTEGFFDGHKPEDVHVITITAGERITDTKLSNYMHKFRSGLPDDFSGEKEQPTTYGMQLLIDVLTPAIPYAAYTNDAEHKKLFQQAKQNLSRLNFFSHSFGSMVVAEASHYLPQLMESKGFTHEEGLEALRCMGRLSVGAPYHIAPEFSTIPGIDFNSALDRLTEKYRNIPAQHDSKVLVMEKVGESLLFCPLTGKNTVPIVWLIPTSEATEEERRTFTTRLNPQKKSPWEEIHEEISDANCHALQLYMYNHRLQIDATKNRQRQTGQAFPGAEVTSNFMSDLFETSANSIATGIPRDTRILVNRIAETLKTPESRNRLAEAMEVANRDMGAGRQ